MIGDMHGSISDKSSAVAEMGDRSHNKNLYRTSFMEEKLPNK